MYYTGIYVEQALFSATSAICLFSFVVDCIPEMIRRRSSFLVNY